jgi:protein tyrosine/serine phosphatase
MFVLPTGNDADEILPGLWLGNAKASQNIQFLKEKNIKAIFNCTKDIPFAPLPVNRYRIPVDDNLQAGELRNLELWSFEIVAKIAKERRLGHPILVHCAAGMQRSAAVVAMYLIATQQLSKEEAIKAIRQKRSIAFMPMANFGTSISGFEKSLVQLLLTRV